MKVKFTNKKLWNSYLKFVSAISSILSLILTFIDFEQDFRIKIALISIVILIISFAVLWVMANQTPRITLNINDTNFNIFFGDIFAQDGNKVIPFNEFFDTKVDDKIIAKSTLNGIFLDKYVQNCHEIDNCIHANTRMKKYEVENGVLRKYGGKTVRYKLGTICPKDDFFLLALTHFSENNQAYITVSDYISALMHMWNELDVYYAGNSISIPLLGAGITRFNNCNVSEQELLKYIVMTFKASKIKFNNGALINLILSKNIREKVNLYDIKEK